MHLLFFYCVSFCLRNINPFTLIVWLLHSRRLEVMCTLVRMVWDATEPVMCKGVSECKTVSLGEEYLKSLTQRCTESLSSSP